MSIQLLNEERILAQDTCKHHSGPIAFEGKLILSNLRLIFQPTGRLDRLAGAEVFSINIEFIQEITREGIDRLLHIHTVEKVFRFSGGGSSRLEERLHILLSTQKGEELNLKDLELLNEIVILQGALDIYRGPLATAGEFMLSEQSLKVKSKRGLESLLFSKINLHIAIEDLNSLNFDPLSQKLSISSNVGNCVIGGAQVVHIYLLLCSLRDGQFNSNRPIFEINLHQGPLQTKGVMIATSKRLLFCPLKALDSLVGRKAISLPVAKLDQLYVEGWPEPRLKLVPLKGNPVIFGGEECLQKLRSLTGTLCAYDSPALFKDLRLVEEVNKAQGDQVLKMLGVDTEAEILQLCEWAVYYVDDQTLQLGWLVVSKQKVRFISPKKGEVWSARIKEISIARKSKESDPIIQIQHEGKLFTIVPKGGANFNITFWGCINGIQPTREQATERKGQSVRNILGSFPKLLIFNEDLPEDQSQALVFEDVVISKKPRGIRVMLKHRYGFKIDVNDILLCEVPKNEGRFRFYANICEAYVIRPDPIGRHYFTFDVPQDIAVHNERSSFRIEYNLALEVHRYSLKAGAALEDATLPDKFYIDPLPLEENIFLSSPFEKPDVVEDKDPRSASFYDISLGGCALSYRGKLMPRNIPPEDFFLLIELPFEDSKIPVLARIVNSRPNRDNPKFTIYGCRFLNLSPLAAQRVRQEIVRLEREKIRELISMEERARNLGLL